MKFKEVFVSWWFWGIGLMISVFNGRNFYVSNNGMTPIEFLAVIIGSFIVAVIIISIFFVLFRFLDLLFKRKK